MNIDKSLNIKKEELLNYFRNRAEELLSEIKFTYGNAQFKEQASAINRATDNNHYFQTLKNSGIWDAYSGNEAYDKMNEYSGFNIKNWIATNIDWENDFKIETIQYFRDNNLTQYLIW